MGSESCGDTDCSGIQFLDRLAVAGASDTPAGPFQTHVHDLLGREIKAPARLPSNASQAANDCLAEIKKAERAVKKNSGVIEADGREMNMANKALARARRLRLDPREMKALEDRVKALKRKVALINPKPPADIESVQSTRKKTVKNPSDSQVKSPPKTIHSQMPAKDRDSPKKAKVGDARFLFQEVNLDEKVSVDPSELKPNTDYNFNGYTWRTDSNGNVCHVEGELKLASAKRHLSIQSKTGHRGIIGEDDGGHLIGSRFGGFGSGPNLIPQARGLNRSWGAWYKMEDVWADALEHGRRVWVSIDLAGNEFRPDMIVVNFTIGGQAERRGFLNEDIAC